MKTTIFLSCGQSHLWPEEKKVAANLKSELDKLGYNVFVAKDESTIQNLNRELLNHLKNSDYYLFIDFKREFVINTVNKTMSYRGSLYSNQELGMAYALGFDSTNMLLFTQSDVESNGIYKAMTSNNPKFNDYDEVTNTVLDCIKRNWSPCYSRKLSVKSVKINMSPITWTDRYMQKSRNERIALMEVCNRRSDIVAFNCIAHLASICGVNNSTINFIDNFPIKCCGVDSYKHTIWPNTSEKFDLFGIEENTNKVFMHTQCDMFKNGSRIPIIEINGQYILTYEIYAENFPIYIFEVELNLSNQPEIYLRKNEVTFTKNHDGNNYESKMSNYIVPEAKSSGCFGTDDVLS